MLERFLESITYAESILDPGDLPIEDPLPGFQSRGISHEQSAGLPPILDQSCLEQLLRVTEHFSKTAPEKRHIGTVRNNDSDVTTLPESVQTAQVEPERSIPHVHPSATSPVSTSKRMPSIEQRCPQQAAGPANPELDFVAIEAARKARSFLDTQQRSDLDRKLKHEFDREVKTNIQTIRQLLDQGADVNSCIDGFRGYPSCSILYLAVRGHSAAHALRGTCKATSLSRC
jgi:hypothetical protein